MMHILGISAFYHDSATCLVHVATFVAVAQQERFTRKNHDHRFPQWAIEFCLAEGGIAPAHLDSVAFPDKPLAKFDRLLETYVAYAPAGFRSFKAAIPLWLREKLHLPREMDRGRTIRSKGITFHRPPHEWPAAGAFIESRVDRRRRSVRR